MIKNVFNDSMTLSLIILAAGKASRYGGNKALAEVGPGGQALFEYSIHDALKAGFTHVVFVVNSEQDTSDFSNRLKHYGNRVKVEFVVQNLGSKLISERLGVDNTQRSKPWGTGHAVLICRDHIANPFVVINADDYYGSQNFATVGNYLINNAHNPKVGVLPGYKLKHTLSSSGGVNRGICKVDVNGYLKSIQEVTDIYLGSTLLPRTEHAQYNEIVHKDAIVSMTFWGFHPAIFNLLETAYASFLRQTPDLVNDEFFIPAAIDLAIKSKITRFKVFHTSQIWKGLTYAADLAEVREYISQNNAI